MVSQVDVRTRRSHEKASEQEVPHGCLVYWGRLRHVRPGADQWSSQAADAGHIFSKFIFISMRGVFSQDKNMSVYVWSRHCLGMASSWTTRPGVHAT